MPAPQDAPTVRAHAGCGLHGVPSPEPMPSAPMPLPEDFDEAPPLPTDQEPVAPVEDPVDGVDAPVRLPGWPQSPPVRVLH